MDHREFPTGLAPAIRAQLTQTSDRAGLLHLAGHGGLITGLGLWIGLGLPG